MSMDDYDSWVSLFDNRRDTDGFINVDKCPDVQDFMLGFNGARKATKEKLSDNVGRSERNSYYKKK